MHVASLRKVGGSVMLTLPPALLELLNLRAGTTVGVLVQDGRLVIEPKPSPRFTMSELLAASDYSEPTSEDDRHWASSPARGRELL